MITPENYPFIIAVALIALVSLVGIIIAKRRGDDEPEETADEPNPDPTEENNN